MNKEERAKVKKQLQEEFPGYKVSVKLAGSFVNFNIHTKDGDNPPIDVHTHFIKRAKELVMEIIPEANPIDKMSSDELTQLAKMFGIM